MSTILREIQACALGPATRTSDGAREMIFIFPPSFLGFNGHFPDQPILPAMVQVLTGILAARGDSPLQLKKIGRAKFMRIVKPGEKLKAHALTSTKNGYVHAQIQLSVEGEPCAILPLVLEPADTAS
ncbi:MAG: hypothetical protein PHO79_07170, partial [Desulfoplanes sp.]|nr:hypothetical protein [Desulfoplanes sp.]